MERAICEDAVVVRRTLREQRTIRGPVRELGQKRETEVAGVAGVAEKMDPSSPRQEEKLELAVRAAWLYHVAGNTQHEISRKLQISRPTAQRLVAFAF